MKMRIIMIFIQAVSAFLIGGGALLGYLSKKKMGVLRSLTYRNMKLEAMVLTQAGCLILIGVGILLLAMVTLFVYRGKLKVYSGTVLYLVLVNCGMLLSFFYYKTSSFMGGPWIFLGFAILSIGSGALAAIKVNR